jgi:hypothetical protein
MGAGTAGRRAQTRTGHGHELLFRGHWRRCPLVERASVGDLPSTRVSDTRGAEVVKIIVFKRRQETVLT